MRKLLLALALLVPSLAFGQGLFSPQQTAFTTVNGTTRPLPFASITVCAANASGIPCAPAIINTIFSNSALTQGLANPFFADANGNYQFAAAPGAYTVTVSATGFTGQSYQVTLGLGGSPFVFTGAVNVTGLLSAAQGAFSGSFTAVGGGQFAGNFTGNHTMSGVVTQTFPTVAGGSQAITGCSLSATSGGSFAGAFRSGTTGTCTATIVPGITAPNGFSCWASDINSGVVFHQTSYTTTTCVIAATTTTADIIVWGAVAF